VLGFLQSEFGSCIYTLRLPIAIRPAVTTPKKSLHASISFASMQWLNSIVKRVAISKILSPGTHLNFI